MYEYAAYGIKEKPRPAAGQAFAEIAEGIVAVPGFIIKIAGNKEKYRKMEQIDESRLDPAMSHHDGNDRQSLYNIPVSGMFLSLAHSVSFAFFCTDIPALPKGFLLFYIVLWHSENGKAEN